MALKDDLKRLVETSTLDLGSYAWKYETDRWAELVFCLLNQVVKQDPQTTRDAVHALQYLGLLEIERVAAGEESECGAVARYVLGRYGFSASDAARALGCVVGIARVLQRDFGGKIQRYLRSRGSAMRDEMVGMLRSQALTDEETRFAVSHWLQNVLGLPVSLEHEAVRKYCQAQQVTPQDLWQAADELDLNMALVDDLLDLEAAKSAGRENRGEA